MARDPGSLNDGLHLKLILTDREKKVRRRKRMAEHRWAVRHLLQLLHTHGVNRDLTSSTFLPRYWLLLQKIKSKNVFSLHEKSREPTQLTHEVYIWPQGGAKTHQGFGKAVLFSNITEVSGAAGLEPDVFPVRSIVLGNTEARVKDLAEPERAFAVRNQGGERRLTVQSMVLLGSRCCSICPEAAKVGWGPACCRPVLAKAFLQTHHICRRLSRILLFYSLII